MQPLLCTLSRWGLGFGAVVGVVLALTAPWMSRIFTTDLTVIDYATTAIIVSAFFQPVAGYVFLLDGILIGAATGVTWPQPPSSTSPCTRPSCGLSPTHPRSPAPPHSPLQLVWLAYSAVYIGHVGPSPTGTRRASL